MARPSRNIELALLHSGRELYAQRGSALSVRALAEHAKANLGMFHYHFKSKEAFLRQMLAGMYEEMFAQLEGQVAKSGPVLYRLREALTVLAHFVRDHTAILGRVIADAGTGDAVAIEFLRTNAPRHLGVLVALMEQAQSEGLLLPMAPLQRFTFVMGAVAGPLFIVPGIRTLGVAPEILGDQLQAQVVSDEAIAERIELALRALSTGRDWS